MKVELRSPDGTSFWLSNRNGGDDGSGYTNTCFRSNGFNGYIHQAEAPFFGEYIPDGRLDFVNNGQNPNGEWLLLIRDLRKGESGQLHLISLEFGNNPTPNSSDPPCDFDNGSACSCAGEKNKCKLLPDLVILEKFTQGQIKEYAWDDPYYPGQLRFAATIANIGDGPMEVLGKGEWVCGSRIVDSLQTCADGSKPRQKIYQRIYRLRKNKLKWKDREAGTNYYDDKPGHDHFHVDAWVEFRLTKQLEGERKVLVAKANKVSYCLFDSGACNNQDSLCNWKDTVYGQTNLPNYGLGNYSSCDAYKQGISVGGYDTYGMLYEGQFIQLPPDLPNGTYNLEIEVDPYERYLEKDRTNNLFSMPVNIHAQEY